MTPGDRVCRREFAGENEHVRMTHASRLSLDESFVSFWSWHGYRLERVMSTSRHGSGQIGHTRGQAFTYSPLALTLRAFIS